MESCWRYLSPVRIDMRIDIWDMSRYRIKPVVPPTMRAKVLHTSARGFLYLHVWVCAVGMCRIGIFLRCLMLLAGLGAVAPLSP